MALSGTRLGAVAALDMQIRAKGIPIIGVSGPPFVVTYDPSATQAQKDQGDALAAAFDGKDRVFRDLSDLRAGIQALSTAQFTNVWADLSGPAPGVPRKYLADTGPNAPSIWVFDWSLYVSGPTAAQQKAGQISLAAMVVQDQPFYLDAPPFDPTVNVLGVKPVG